MQQIKIKLIEVIKMHKIQFAAVRGRRFRLVWGKKCYQIKRKLPKFENEAFSSKKNKKNLAVRTEQLRMYGNIWIYMIG